MNDFKNQSRNVLLTHFDLIKTKELRKLFFLFCLIYVQPIFGRFITKMLSFCFALFSFLNLNDQLEINIMLLERP